MSTEEKKIDGEVEKKDVPVADLVYKTTIIGDIVRKHPFAIEVFMDYGVHCVGCHVSDFETIEQGILGHGFSEGELLELIEEINDLIRNPPEDDFSDLPV